MIKNVQEINIKFLHICIKRTRCTNLLQNPNSKEIETCDVSFLYIQTMYKLYKTYDTSQLKLSLYVFLHAITNYTKYIQMLIK